MSTILDSIAISPQDCYTLDILHGAGSLTGTVGDVIFHCHLYPHFHEGMWTLLRVHDRLEDGTGRLPDGTVIPPLIPLKDRTSPPVKDDDHPGYPNFINGTFGERPLQPPLGVLTPDGSNKIEPTDLEQDNFVNNFAPGDYLYYFGGIDDAWLGLWGILRAHVRPVRHLKPLCRGKDQILPLPPCPGKDAVIRRYEIAAIQRNIPYNNYGNHDPEGLLFVPLEDADQALCGHYQPKPLILRANAGEWIEVTLHNLFHPEQPVEYFDYPRVPLDMKHQPSMRVSLTPQFLSYDPICDSGINVGYNNREQTVGVGESKKYLWYADQEYGPCIIHSFGDMRNHRYHGLFGAIIIEPAGAVWYRSFSLSRALHEDEAVITAPGTENF